MMKKTTHFKTKDGEGLEFIEYEDDIIFPSEFMPDPEKKLAGVKNLPLKNSVVVVTYPKCGTHWVANMVLRLRKKSESDDISRWGFLEMTPQEVLESTSTGNVFTTHLHCKRMPDISESSNVKFVFVLRNPKDVVVSYYHHLKNVVWCQTNQDWSEFFNDFMDGNVPWGSITKFLQSWETEIRENKQLDVGVFYYEDFVEDCFTNLKKLTKFLGVMDKNDEDLAKIVEECSIDNLRSAANKIKGSSKGPRDKDGNSVIYRKGGIGGWKDHFTVAQNEKFDEIITQPLNKSYFKFRYE